MRLIYKKGLKPTKSAEELRIRFKGLINAGIVFGIALAVAWLLDEFVFGYGEGLILVVPILFIYVWVCVALGQLASCFGESASSWALSALFFNGIVLVLAYFAFGEAVRRAYSQVGESPEQQ